jgi:NUMOD4 motif.
MTKFEARKKEVVDAYQFTGGEKDGLALVEILGQGGVNGTWLPMTGFDGERIKIVTDTSSEYMYVGSWLVLRLEDNVITHMTNDEFVNRYVKLKIPQAVLIWKDIPGFPNWQVSDNGRVRNTRFAGYKKRTKDGDFILLRKGRPERWSEAQLGDEPKIRAFFAAD